MHVTALSKTQIGRIHEASLRILTRTGFHLPHPETRARLAAGGAKVDDDAERVYLTEKIVYESLESAQKQFTIYGRDGAQKASFGTGNRNYNSIAGEAYWVDSPGGPRRSPGMEDVGLAAKFAERLKHINIAGAMSDPADLPREARCIEVMARLLNSTTKPITFWFHDRKSAVYIVEMCTVVAGSEESATKKPICYPLLEPISPLRFPFLGVDLLYETARLDMPVHIGPMAQMGASAPMSVAGTLALENAEILAGVCVTQAIKEGMPVCYGGICHAFDMRTTQMIFGGPEQAIFGVAMTQMGKHYGLPVYINVGLTDSKLPDAQAGAEIGTTLILGAAAGADVFGHMGICGVDQASSFDILILQDEIIGFVESAMREIGTDDEILGIDVVDAVGPGGSFLDTEHTADNFRDQLWFPGLFDRNFYEIWREGGGQDTAEKCRARKDEILNSPPVEPMPEDMAKAIDDIVNSARRHLIG